MMEKQIEEMAKVIREADILCGDCGQYGDTYCAEAIAKVLTENGYRKQSEGEWIEVENVFLYRYKCSLCENVMLGKMKNFCPNCGARMKGGEEE